MNDETNIQNDYNELDLSDAPELVNPKYTKDKQTRKFIITQNNPQEYGLGTPEAILKRTQGIQFKYMCFCFERAPTTGTYHFHLYIDFGTPRGFRTPHNLFPRAHIQAAKGSVLEIRDYIGKTGKHANTPAAALNDRATFTEVGSFDTDKTRATRRNEAIISELKEGKTALNIIEDRPELIFKKRQLSELEESYRYDRVPTVREVEVIYMCGETGSGKTWLMLHENEPDEVCRITSYPTTGGVKFDSYTAQKVLAFEEYRSQISISDMLSYLDVYKMWLPARYSDKVSAYEKVYITSNWRLEEQYKSVQLANPATWKAFVRRIDKVRVFTDVGKYVEYSVAVEGGNLKYTEITSEGEVHG